MRYYQVMAFCFIIFSVPKEIIMKKKQYYLPGKKTVILKCASVEDTVEKTVVRLKNRSNV